MDTLKYCIKRIILAVVTVFIIIAITFFAMNTIPGGPFDSEKALSEDVKAVLMARYHLDQPLYIQFFNYINNILHGDFGISIKTGRSITETIRFGFSVSAVLGFKAIVLAVIGGILLGCIAAAFAGKWPDRLIVLLTSVIVSLPSFVIASLLLLIFCIKLKWVASWDPANPSTQILPVIALAVYPMANIERLTKTSMLDVLGQNYIRMARAKGLPEWKVLFKHAFRNAAIPVVTYLGPATAGILTGSVVIETVFTIGGLGSQFVSAITNRDYSLIMGTTVFMAVLIVLSTLISDIVYKLFDPRIKL